MSLLLGILSPFLGIVGSLLPSIIRIFEKKQDLQHEIELTKIKMDAAVATANTAFDTEAIKGLVQQGQSLRDHDKSLDGGVFINTLRASIRPVITYLFFGLFVIVKTSAAWVMLANGMDVPSMLAAVWDEQTMSLFSTILAFWFGSRIFERYASRQFSK